MTLFRRAGSAATGALAFLGLVTTATADSAIRPFDAKRFVRVDARLNVRAAPSTKARVIRRLKNETRVHVVALKGAWREIASPVKGWVLGKYLRATVRRYVKPAHAKVRQGPSSGEKTVKTLRRGTAVSVKRSQGRWREILRPVRGWVPGKSLSRSRPRPPRWLGGDGDVARVLYQEARRARASSRVLVALFEAAVVESGMRNLRYGDRDSLGVLQIRWRMHGYRTATNVHLSARWFLRRAKPIQYRYGSAGSLAQAVQGSAYPYRYNQVYGRASAWIRWAKGQ